MFIYHGTRYQVLYKAPPSGCGCVEILGVSQVEKGEHRRSSTHVHACMRFAAFVPVLLDCPSTTRVLEKVGRSVGWNRLGCFREDDTDTHARTAHTQPCTHCTHTHAGAAHTQPTFVTATKGGLRSAAACCLLLAAT